MNEEMEHATMVLEWLRRNEPAWAEHMDTYLYTTAPITAVEEEATGGGEAGGTEAGGSGGKGKPGFTVGDLK